MSKTIEELEKMFEETNKTIATIKNDAELQRKDFELKLKSAEANVKQYQELAEKREEDLRKFQQDQEKRDKESAEKLAKAKETEISEFVESSVKAGKIIPAIKDKVVAFMKSLTSESDVMTFTEKDGSKRTHTQISLFKEIINRMKPIMPVGQEFSEKSTQEVEEPSELEQPVEKFAEVIKNGNKVTLPVQDFDIAEKAKKYQEENKCDYETALLAVSPRRKAS